MAEVSLVKLPLDECHWLYWWYVNIGSEERLVPSGSAIRQQAITWASVYPDLSCHMALGHNLLNIHVLVFCRPWIENMKIIRDNTPNMYMVLVKFRGQVSIIITEIKLIYQSIFHTNLENFGLKDWEAMWISPNFKFYGLGIGCSVCMSPSALWQQTLTDQF